MAPLGATLETWLGEATERMLDRAGVTAGLPGCSKWPSGAGGQTLTAARRVGPDGLVVATDISPVILIYAAKQAAEHRLTNVETVEADGEQPGDLTDGTLGAVICRLGVIYIPTRSAP